MRRLATALIATTLVTFALPLSAQLTLKDIEATAPSESDRVQKLMSALENPDPNYRMHAFRTIVTNGSEYERRLALQRAFLGTDVNLRHAALKHRLSEMPVLRIEIARPEKDTKLVGQYFGSRRFAWIELRMVPADLKTGRFQLNSQDAFVIDDQFMVEFFPSNLTGSCIVEFELSDQTSLVGQVNCSTIPRTMARAPLF